MPATNATPRAMTPPTTYSSSTTNRARENAVRKKLRIIAAQTKKLIGIRIHRAWIGGNSVGSIASLIAPHTTRFASPPTTETPIASSKLGSGNSLGLVWQQVAESAIFIGPLPGTRLATLGWTPPPTILLQKWQAARSTTAPKAAPAAKPTAQPTKVVSSTSGDWARRTIGSRAKKVRAKWAKPIHRV